MREILFRGKRFDNSEWAHGNLFYDSDIELTQILGFEYSFGENGTERQELSYHVDRSTIGQYTGLHDKNGTMIFEGDIISVSNYMLDEEDGNAVVLWDDESAIFAISFKGIATSFDQVFYGDCEVIGNIYDNGELIFDGGSGDVYDI